MGALEGLKFVIAKRSLGVPQVVVRRNKLIKKLAEQEAVAQAELGGSTYNATKLRFVKDTEGNTKTVEVAKRVRRWTYTGEDGKLYLVVKYGNKQIAFEKGKEAILVGDLKGLLATLAVLKTAVAAGELDAQIESVAGAVKTSFAK